MITGVHHINLLVRDLEAGMAKWRDQLGVCEFEIDELPGRGVRTARFRAGPTWIVLVQPVAPGEPQRVLEEQGEGLFLLSLSVDDLDRAVDVVRSGGGSTTSPQPRSGLDDWRIIDLSPESICQGRIQLTDSEP